MNFMEIYSEAGMIGVVGALLVYLVYSMSKRGNEQANAIEELKIENKGQSETLENMEGMVIKLIDRWNKSDEKLDRKFDDLTKEGYRLMAHDEGKEGGSGGLTGGMNSYFYFQKMEYVR